jgi:hypothetical protein
MAQIKINTSEEVTSKLPFIPYSQFNNFCPAYLTGVEFTDVESKEDSKWEFRGCTIPRLAFYFTEYKLSADEKTRYFSHSELPITVIKVDGTASTDANLEKRFTEMWKRIKHIHDQFSECKNYKAIDFTINFNTDGDITKRLASIKKFFINVSDAFNIGADGKTPIYSKNDLLLLKLIASGKNLSYLAFPSFVNRGFIEKVNIKDGKIESTLAFHPSETVELGVSAIANASSVPAGNNATPGISDELRRKLGMA